MLILIGAGLLYGDGALTPAISVLSAVEGIGVLNPSLEPLVVPITCVILLVLFLVQSRGTQLLGKVFGPVMIGWFTLIGGLGLVEVLKEPTVIRALSPTYAFQTLTGNGIHGFLLLGSIILAVTGAEALYADMGHFGSPPDPAGVVLAGQARAGPGLPRPGRDRDQRARRPPRTRCTRWPRTRPGS